MINKLKKITSHSVAKNSFFLFILQFFSMIAPLIVLPYLSRILGIDGFGLLMLALSASGIGLIITNYGFNLSATYTISKNREKISYVSELIGAIFFIKLSLALLFILFTLLYVYFFPSEMGSTTLALYISLNILVQAFLPTWFFQGIERMKHVTIYMVIAKISYVFLVFSFVNQKEDVERVILLLALSNVIAAVIAIKYIYKNKYSIKKPTLKLIIITFKDSSQFFLSRAAVSIYTTASTFLVGAFAGMQQAAIYGASEKLYQATQSMTTTVSQALFPYMAKNNNTKLLVKIIFSLGIPLTIGCFIVGFWANEVMVIIFGEDFYQAGNILKFFLLVTVVNFVSVNYGYPAFAGIGKIHIANYTVMLGALVQAICLLLLFVNDAVTSINVVVSVLITEIVVMLSRIFIYRYYKNL
jgi:O-antigen/teichoic acid export membrane protein